MTVHRRDVLKYLGLSAGMQLLLARIGHASDGASETLLGSRTTNPPASRGRTTFLPFTLNGRNGRAAVTYGVTEDPVAAGFDIIPKLGFDPTLCRGYPTIRGVIESYEGSGYRTLCAWVQVVTGKYYRAGGESAGPAETSVSVDKLPSMMDVALPFASFGNSPQLFDAPCRNLNGYQHLRWTADTFLTTVPVRSKEEEIERLLSVRWGYVEYESSSHRPVSPLPLVVTDASAWNGLLPFLKKSFPDWRFAAAK